MQTNTQYYGLRYVEKYVFVNSHNDFFQTIVQQLRGTGNFIVVQKCHHIDRNMQFNRTHNHRFGQPIDLFDSLQNFLLKIYSDESNDSIFMLRTNHKSFEIAFDAVISDTKIGKMGRGQFITRRRHN